MSNPAARADPFGQGMTAYSDGLARLVCPFPPAFFESRLWLLGWEHSRSRLTAMVCEEPGS